MDVGKRWGEMRDGYEKKNGKRWGMGLGKE